MAQAALDKAKKSYSAGKDAKTLSGQKAYFQDAARAWEEGLSLLGAHHFQQRSAIHKNLAKAQQQLAFLAAEESVQKASAAEKAQPNEADARLRYHVEQMVVQMKMRAGSEPVEWAEFTDMFAREVMEKAPNLTMRLALLKAFAARVPRQPGLAEMIAQVHVHKALRAVPDADYSDALMALHGRHSRHERRGSLLMGAEETAKWVEVSQEIQSACVMLASSCLPTDEAQEEAVIDLIDQARFLIHRSSIVRRLCQALEMQDDAMLNDDFDMHRCLEVLDALIDTLHVAQRDIDIPCVLGDSKMDVEMTCVCLHHLAKFYAILRLTRQAHLRHKECVELALSLDGTGVNLLFELVEGRSAVKGVLATKPWFKESVAFLQIQQRQKQKEQEAEHENKKAKIRKQLNEIEKANIGDKPLIKYLLQNYPPSKRCHSPDFSAETIPKRVFMELIRAYHPDKQSDGNSPQGLTHESWILLCGEISKMLNYYYERDHKPN